MTRQRGVEIKTALERKAQILALLQNHSKYGLGIEAIASALFVSNALVRRYCKQLSDSGAILVEQKPYNNTWNIHIYYPTATRESLDTFQL